MTYTSLLISTCTVRRWTVDPLDPIDEYGNPKRVWADHLTNQDCRLSNPKGQQIQRGTEVVLVEQVLFMEDVDVTEQDRVIVDGITYEVLFVAGYQDSVGDHHKQLWLKRVIP